MSRPSEGKTKSAQTQNGSNMAKVVRDPEDDATVEVDGKTVTTQVAFKASAPVRLDQLTYEARDVLAGQGLSADGDPMGASDAEPAKIWVAHPEVGGADFDVDAFLKVAAKHRADSRWDYPDADSTTS